MAFVDGLLLKHFAASLYRLAIGYTLAVTLGVTVGALLSLRPTLRSLFEPVLTTVDLRADHRLAACLVNHHGPGGSYGDYHRFLGAFFAITLNTTRGIESVHKNLVQAAQIMGVHGLQLFFSVLLPGSLVSLITGLRLGIRLCLACIGRRRNAGCHDHSGYW